MVGTSQVKSNLDTFRYHSEIPTDEEIRETYLLRTDYDFEIDKYRIFKH